MRAHLCALLAVAAGLSMHSTASAQANHVAWSYVESESWTYHPVYTVDSLGAITISNIVAIMDTSAAVTDNLVAVWYERDSSGNWDASSWNTTDPWIALKWVKAALSISDSEDDRWQIPGTATAATLLAPEMYSYGVLASDAMADDIPIDPDPDALVAFLVSSGYKAANPVVQRFDGCKVNDKLDGMAAALYETLVGTPSTGPARSMAAWVGSGTIGCEFAQSSVEIVEYPPVPTTIPLHTFNCEQRPDEEIILDGEPPIQFSSTCLNWKSTYSVTQTRTRTVYVIETGETLVCVQTRSGTFSETYSCCAFGERLKPPPCPTASNPDMGQGCGTGGFGALTHSFSNYTWGPWTPACPF